MKAENESTNGAVLRLGTRGSLLARMQSQLVADAVEEANPGLKVELVIVKTSGDRIQNRPLTDAGGKGLFTKELEQALIKKKVDFAVHSFKDVPVTMPLVDTSGLVFAAVPKREDVRDVLVSTKSKSLSELRKGVKVGTSSLRRRAQVLARRPDLKVENLRGNIDTRINKMKEGRYDAIILACAGLRRSGLFDGSCMNCIEIDEMLPAAGQGALAIQCRREDRETMRLLAQLNDVDTYECVKLERAMVEALKGDCHSPIGVLARKNETGVFELQAVVGGRDGQPPLIRAEGRGKDPKEVLAEVYGKLDEQGVQEMLSGGR